MTTTANPLPAANSRLPFCLRRLGKTRCSLPPSGLGSPTAFGNMRSILSRILSNQRMKTTRLIVLAMLSALVLAVADITPTPLPPPVSLKEAVRIAEDYVAEKKINVSQHYLASIRVQSDAQGRIHWDAQWMDTDRGLKGGWFIVRVQMDKTVAVIPGK